ncbi:hypothetical protein [Oceanisphaera pacifica]|uniref:Uncharacterized protein n=1 Tax=Oceanisphaera pacifica TaxID=2818389 RepID=A0ABS3NCR3_9GAMM|nr:hypothetical protein [Oceanisphaera pacifica]MBO1518162.1 hypothetical protein [Oceanisphaera pacifica]
MILSKYNIRTMCLMTSLVFISSISFAGVIKPDCDISKAAKNAALESTVGVSGRCDASKTAKQAKDEALEGVTDKVDNTKDAISDTKNNAANTIGNVKDEPAKAAVKLAN